MVELIKRDVGYVTGSVIIKLYLFQGSDSLYYQRCLQRNEARTLQGKRLLKVGRLRPNVLLYSEPHPDDKEILEVAKHNLRICPELVLIVGTKLGIRIDDELARKTKDRVVGWL
jgi:NAD-dependent SIR2 family protein deacetylase